MAKTKDDPFALYVDDSEVRNPKADCSVHINRKEHDFRFTRRWFRQRNQATFSSFILPRFPSDQPHFSIQIGVFEGMDLVWQFQNTLAHPGSRAIAIDPWEATTKLDQEKMDEHEVNARHNLSPFRNKLEVFKGTSQTMLEEWIKSGVSLEINNRHLGPGQFDYVIIDGDHRADPVYADAVLALQLVKVGGWLIFDDVRNQIPKRKDHVVHGLRRFVDDFGSRIKLTWYHRYCNCYERIE